MQGEVATARAEANERKIRAKEADEMAKLEKMKRESEEKLRLDATEREKKVNKHTLSLARSLARTHARTYTHKQTC
jgi:aminoglycoside phosphotransferase family enzyme